jgi:SOS-response transcriptional repressor LexA
MKRSPSQLEMKFVSHYGEVGAGAAVDNIIPFMPQTTLVPVVVRGELAAAGLGAVTVRGLSLTDLGIHDGDTLVISKRFTYRDIDENTICIVFIHPTGELVAKRIIKEANTITLRASGGGLPDKQYRPDEVEIRGIVVRISLDVETYIARHLESKVREGRPYRNGGGKLI